MSGGAFDYKEYWIQEISRQIEETLDIHEHKYEGLYDSLEDCSEETINVIKEGTKLLRKAYSFAYNVDRLIEGDTSEGSFLKYYNKECQDIEEGNYEKGKYFTEND